MNNKKNLILILIILVIVILLTLYFLVFQKDREFVVRDKDSFTSQEDYLNYLEEYKVAQSKDTYGGKTPEETLNLFVEALKAGNTELASRYFVLSKQNEIKEDLKQGVESGGIKTFVDIIGDSSNKFDSKKSSVGEYFISVIEKENNSLILEIRLSLNSESKLWKIENL
ncbi:MAG: hypothetical protein WC849_02415 [Candidatus Paceibacterota bacterium]